MMRRWSVLALVSALVASPATAQPPEGYFLLASLPSLPDTLHETHEEGRFSIRIDRDVAPEHREFLDVAERLHPNPALIEADIEAFLRERSDMGVGNWPRSFREAAERPGPRWWWRTFDEVPIPWAVTGLTAHELTQQVRAFAREPLGFFDDDTRIRFRYTASVETDDSGNRVVTLTAYWDMRCGSLCGLTFEHARVVTFDSDGDVVDITGDRQPLYIVS